MARDRLDGSLDRLAVEGDHRQLIRRQVPAMAGRRQPHRATRAVNEHAKPHGGRSRCWFNNQMQIAGVEAVRDPPVGRVQHYGLPLHRPITRKRPLIEPQPPPTR